MAWTLAPDTHRRLLRTRWRWRRRRTLEMEMETEVGVGDGVGDGDSGRGRWRQTRTTSETTLEAGVVVGDGERLCLLRNALALETEAGVGDGDGDGRCCLEAGVGNGDGGQRPHDERWWRNEFKRQSCAVSSFGVRQPARENRGVSCSPVGACERSAFVPETKIRNVPLIAGTHRSGSVRKQKHGALTSALPVSS